MLIPVILAGGLGSRLWPLSRQDYPKHLLTLLGKHSLLQSTILRAGQLTGITHLMLVCNEQHEDLLHQQLDELLLHEPHLQKINFEFILEPIGRNTAPAITLAALNAVHLNDEAQLLILPSDHVLTPVENFINQ